MPNLNYNFKDSYSNLGTVTLPLCVINYTGVLSLTSFTSTIGEISVYPDFSNITPSLSFIENWGYFIDFGDGTTSFDLTGKHIYNIPGDYTLTLVVADSGTNYFKSTHQPIVNIRNIIPDRLFLTTLSGNVLSSGSLTTPLQVTRYNSYQTYPTLSATGYSIKLSVSGNKSKFMTYSDYENSKYSHLYSFATFISGNATDIVPCDNITIPGVNIYAQINPLNAQSIVVSTLTATFYAGYPTYFVGTSGSAKIYYYEDYTGGNYPANPYNLTATASGANRITLNWVQSDTNITGFVIERKAPTADFIVLTSLSNNLSSYTDTTVSANTTYYYRMIAANSYGSSTYSNIANATTEYYALMTTLSAVLTSSSGFTLGVVPY